MATLAANLEDRLEGTVEKSKVRQPVLAFVLLTVVAVVAIFGGGPLVARVQASNRRVAFVGAGSRLKPAVVPVRSAGGVTSDAGPSSARAAIASRDSRIAALERQISSLSARSASAEQAAVAAAATASAAKAEAASAAKAAAAFAPAVAAAAAASSKPPTCGDGLCTPPETLESCFADCPGVTTPATCGEEPHSDPQGTAVVDGRGHKKDSAGECCAACAEHAKRNPKRPCNSWVFCNIKPQCWSLDTGNKHTYGECWLKWQANPKAPLYGQRGRYSEDFRQRHWHAHKHNNLTVPTHVPWAGGVMGVSVDLSVTWETGVDGGMKSSSGETIVDYRPWESKEQNLKRGVKPEQMAF